MKKVYICGLFIGLISSMNAQNDQMYLNFSNKIEGNDMLLNTDAELLDGRAIAIERFDYYLSNISLLKGSDLLEVNIPDSYLLMTQNSTNNFNEHSLGGLDIADIYGVRIHIGIDELTNHADPNLNPSGHPLALQMPSMHWGWSGGYRFLVVEGEVDDNLNGTASEMFQYEAVSDGYYQSFDLIFDAPQNGDIALNIDVHLDKLLASVDFGAVLIQHGSGTQLGTIMTNAVTNDVFVLNQSLLELSENENSIVELYPNPATSSVHISNANGIQSVELINQYGQVLSKRDYNNSKQVKFELSDISSGIYFISCINTRGVKTTEVLNVQ